MQTLYGKAAARFAPRTCACSPHFSVNVSANGCLAVCVALQKTTSLYPTSCPMAARIGSSSPIHNPELDGWDVDQVNSNIGIVLL